MTDLKALYPLATVGHPQTQSHKPSNAPSISSVQKSSVTIHGENPLRTPRCLAVVSSRPEQM